MINQNDSNTLQKKKVPLTCPFTRLRGYLYDAMTDTDCYLTAEDETETSSEEDSDDEIETRVGRVENSDHIVQFTSNLENENEIFFGDNKRTLERKTIVGGSHEDVVEDRQVSAASVESSRDDPEPRRRSYQFAIDEFSDVRLNTGCHGNELADSCKDDEADSEVPDDLDPAEFNHRELRSKSRFGDVHVKPSGNCDNCINSLLHEGCTHSECIIVDLDPVEFRHPRRFADEQRHESALGSSRLSSLKVDPVYKPTPVLQVNHSEWIVSRPATRLKLYLTEEGEERQLGTLPVADEDEGQSESDESASEKDKSEEHIEETAQLCKFEWPVIKATVSETMELICATLVDTANVDDGFVGGGQDTFPSSSKDVAIGKSFDDIPTPDYSSSSSSNESYHSDPDLEEEQEQARETELLTEEKTCLSQPTTPDPDYDILSPVSPMREQLWPDEFTSNFRTKASHNLFTFDNVNSSDSIEMDDAEEMMAVHTPLDRKVSLRTSRYKRRPVPPKSASVLPRLDDEERPGAINISTDEVTHFGREVFTERPLEEMPKNSGVPSVYDSGPVGVPVVLTRQEREVYARPSVMASADLSGVARFQDERQRPTMELNDLAKKTRKNAKKKKVPTATLR